jgi:hypothetical protein
MKNLIEISRIATKKKVRKIEIFDNAALETKNSKFTEFYEALAAGKFKNDRDAATHLYGCAPADDRYRQLKSRFRKRLLNTLFFLDVNLPSASNYDRAYFSCNKDWTLVKILLSNEAHSSAEDLAKSILTTALKFQYADVIVNCARILRRYAAEANNLKDFEEYDEYIKHYSEVLATEILSEEHYQRVMLKYRTPLLQLDSLKNDIESYCDVLVGLSEKYESPIVFYNMYLVWACRYELAHDYEAMLAVCNRAEQYIDDNPIYYQEDKLTAFHLKKMSAYLHLRDFKNGKINAERSLQIFSEGSEIWFVFMEYYLLLALHTDNFINAFAIFNKARGHSKFKKLSAEDKEKWKIYEVYLVYFIEAETGSDHLLKAQSKITFRLYRFLNDPILYPREQRVFTVHLVIAQMLFLLDKNNLQQASERIDRLKSYANKQLIKEENYRIIQFIRLLQQLSKADFKTNELSDPEKYTKRLRKNPYFYRGLISEMEIVPLEKLWNHILAKFKP